jgi:hypothetical protein
MASTQIGQRQLADGSINDAKVQAGAGIVSSKLADGANFLKKDGSVTMTGALNMGSQAINAVATPSVGTDAANKNYVDTQISNTKNLYDPKDSVRAATTVNITISNPGTAVFDGVTLSNGDRLLVKNQTAPAENGIYVFNGSAAALTRALDFDAWTKIPGGHTVVEEGTTQADGMWLSTANQGGTLGTTAITWQQIGVSSGLSSTNFVDKEIPSGSINGANATFTLANTPTAGSEHVYLNGLLQESGAGNDYTISGATITMLTAPLTGDKLRVTYRK